ncbi:hypothetical protein KAW65_02765 [candidate division WOR-3 bacterium]|nr:hypothetical protein [candidate division WOR-3 bacterium]
MLVYVSRKGNTKKYADVLGKLIEIVPVKMNEVRDIEGDLVIIGTPVYNHHRVSSETKEFLAKFKNKLAKCKAALFTVSSHKNEKEIKEIMKLLPYPPVAYASFKTLEHRHKKLVGDLFGTKYRNIGKSEFSCVKTFADKINEAREKL